MNIASLSKDNAEVSKALYNRLRENLEEYYQLMIQIEKKLSKLRMVGAKYTLKDNFGVTVTKNITESVKWNGYTVFYLPAEVTYINLPKIEKLHGNILFLGPAKIQAINNFGSTHHGLNGVTKIILACDLSRFDNLALCFSYCNIEGITIYGSVYDLNHEMTPRFTPKSLHSCFTFDRHLKTVVITGADFSELYSLENAFSNCDDLESIYLENFKNVKIVTAASTFAHCRSLRGLDLSGINTNRLKTFENMCYCCTNLRKVEASTLRFTSDVSVEYMFYECDSLESIDITNWGETYLKYKRQTFYRCYRLKNLGSFWLNLKIKFIIKNWT